LAFGLWLGGLIQLIGGGWAFSIAYLLLFVGGIGRQAWEEKHRDEEANSGERVRA
jgi:uncharacterized membrane protein YdjX (TVP38/TMEM64 family)